MDISESTYVLTLVLVAQVVVLGVLTLYRPKEKHLVKKQTNQDE